MSLIALQNTRSNSSSLPLDSSLSASLASPPAPLRPLPRGIVIGVRKGGTRALLDMIGLHSRVRQARNEIHFFDVDDNYAKGLEWYRAQMPAMTPGEESEAVIAVEKTPSYFNTEAVPARIRAMDAGVLLLLVVRDPVTRLISDYTQIMHNHMERGLQPKSFEELVFVANSNNNNNNSSSWCRPLSSCEVNTRYDAVGKSMYDVHMRRWLRHFPLAQFHVVNGDRLIRKPWQELNKVEDFLGVRREITPDLFYFNSTKGFHCVRFREQDRCLTKSKGRQHPDISRDVVSKLRRFYARHNYDFYDMVGRDFGWPEE